MANGNPKKFATDLTDFAARRGTDGPYADNLDVDVLIVGAGFGKQLSIQIHTGLILMTYVLFSRRRLHAQIPP